MRPRPKNGSIGRNASKKAYERASQKQTGDPTRSIHLQPTLPSARGKILQDAVLV